ncbi:right-handed parallel beta-helix repeat-containing protein [Candidatus Lokiarchaeum ossiferum]|uniref:right-handed parallel beta-helix repeat-containing protein n=1 Tax=Candidatus Lokiarchaeum ossiferum TaxID=2951803 RepID=UPI00352DA4A4
MVSITKMAPRIIFCLSLLVIISSLYGWANYNLNSLDVIPGTETIKKSLNYEFDPKNAQTWNEAYIEIDALNSIGADPLNWSTASLESWCSGFGNITHPYIIENMTINTNGKSHGISISNSKAYFIIRDCYITGADDITESSGIYLYNVTNAQIYNVSLENNHRGIQTYYRCENNTIKDVNITTDVNSDYGIYVRDECENLSVSNCIIDSVQYGVRIDDHCYDLNIYNNLIQDISYQQYSTTYLGTGIYIQNNCENINISSNQLKECEQYGIRISSSSPNNIISHNIISNPLVNQYIASYEGILVESSNNNITFNELNSVRDYGIRLHESTLCNVFNNTMIGSSLAITANDDPTGSEFLHLCIENNTVNNKPIFYYYNQSNLSMNNFTNAAKIFLVQCNDSIISNLLFSEQGYGLLISECLNISVISCISSNNILDGIFLFNSSNCRILHNILSENGRNGIYLEQSCYNNAIINNTLILNLDDGVFIDSSSYNTLFENNISLNVDMGVVIETSSLFNNISTSTIYDNGDDGIYISGNSLNTTIANNNISENYDFGIYLSQASGSSIIGNNISNHRDDGIYLLSSHWVNISDNRINNSYYVSTGVYCIYLYSSDHNLILNNTLIDSSGYTIYLERSEFCSFSENILVGSGIGFYFSTSYISYRNEWTHYFDTSNTVDGKIIYYYLNEIDLSSNNFLDAGQIFLINTNSSVISNQEISDMQFGLFMYSSNQNNILNCNFTHNGANNLFMYRSKNNNFEFNNFSYSTSYATYCYDYCSENRFFQNIMYESNNHGMYWGNYCDNNTIFDNQFIGNSGEAINFYYYCNLNNISNNILYNNYRGIYINYHCDNQTIRGNLIDESLYNGIRIYYYSDNTTIVSNTLNNTGISYSDYRGISITSSCVQTQIIRNVISNVASHGISLNDLCLSTKITLNNITNCGKDGYSTYTHGYGIYIGVQSDFCEIFNNTIKDCFMSGVYFYDRCNYATISFNTISNNEKNGVQINNVCNNNDLINNSISFNSMHGIRIESNCDSNDIINCSIFNNTDHGVYITLDCESTIVYQNAIKNNSAVGLGLYSDSRTSLIYFNNFTGNGLHAVDEGFLNQWDNETHGNYWCNYSGDDLDDDGIGSIPYIILSNGVDRFPLWWDGINLQPLPNITSPDDISYYFGYLSYKISWVANTTFPEYYNITRNGSLVAAGLWENNVPIVINVDSLQVGLYYYVCTVNTTRGDFSSDTVMVTVIRTYPIITSSDDVEMNVTETVDPIIWSVNTPLEDTALIYRNGILIESNTSWNSDEPFIIEITNLDPGIYTFELYVNSTSNEIAYDSITVTVLEPPPTISHPDDRSYIVLSSNNNITWVGTSPIPDYIKIFKDNILIFANPWNSSENIILPIDGLMPGVYLYECYLNTTTGNVVYDAVIITVIEPNIEISHPVDKSFLINQIGQNITWVGNSLIPDKVKILKDGEVMFLDNWTSSLAISIDLDGLIAGSYLYECILNSTSGMMVYDSVVVIVLDPVPTISQPQDVVLDVNQTASTITWYGNSPNPGNVIIKQNGVIIYEGEWQSGEPIAINVNNLTAGTYLFECILVSASGVSVSDSVLIVVEDPNADIGTGDGTENRGNAALWWVISILAVLLAGSISTIVFLIWRQRNFGLYDNITPKDISKNAIDENKVILMTDSDRQILDEVSRRQEEPKSQEKKSRFSLGKLKRSSKSHQKKFYSPKDLEKPSKIDGIGTESSVTKKKTISEDSKQKNLSDDSKIEKNEDKTQIIRPPRSNKVADFSNPEDEISINTMEANNEIQIIPKKSKGDNNTSKSDSIIKEELSAAKRNLKDLANTTNLVENKLPSESENLKIENKTELQNRTITEKKSRKRTISKEDPALKKKISKKSSRKTQVKTAKQTVKKTRTKTKPKTKKTSNSNSNDHNSK